MSCPLSLSQAIYELSRGEQDLIEDLKLARKASIFLLSLWSVITYKSLMRSSSCVQTECGLALCFEPTVYCIKNGEVNSPTVIVLDCFIINRVKKYTLQ